MPSKKPRVNLTLDEDLNQLLDDIAKLTGKPKARFIAELLNDTKPMLIELRKALTNANDKLDTLPQLMQISAMANSKTAIINDEMAKVLKND